MEGGGGVEALHSAQQSRRWAVPGSSGRRRVVPTRMLPLAPGAHLIHIRSAVPAASLRSVVTARRTSRVEDDGVASAAAGVAVTGASARAASQRRDGRRRRMRACAQGLVRAKTSSKHKS